MSSDHRKPNLDDRKSITRHFAKG